MPLNLLHLSDIHFKYYLDGTVYDLDHDVRNEVAIDIDRVVQRSGPIDAIVITGDIAFAGKADDYRVAKEWLATLCSRVGCEAEHVWVVPGNHDVDWTRVTPLVRGAQDWIQTAPAGELDDRIRQSVFEDDAGAAALAAPFGEYNKFAAIYGCKPADDELAWQADLKLDGYKLRLVGLNSAFVSNKDDDEAARPLVLGQAQLDLPRTPGRLYMTLCHHPPSWLKDGEGVKRKLENRVSLQLFGHVHEQALQRCQESLTVQAGALQPDRQEDPWYPTYNVLTLSVTETDTVPALLVTAYPRVWLDSHRFGPDSLTGSQEELGKL